MGKGAKRHQGQSEKKSASALPPGYLPVANPPRQSAMLLAVATVLLVLWMFALAYLAFWG
jgi:hypothetical protein